MFERPDEPKISQRMDPEKLALVEKFLKDADDTRSTTTKTGDSGYWTQTVESEFAQSETSGKYNVTNLLILAVGSAVVYK